MTFDYATLFKETSLPRCTAALNRKKTGTYDEMIATCEVARHNWLVRAMFSPNIYPPVKGREWQTASDALRDIDAALQYWKERKACARTNTRAAAAHNANVEQAPTSGKRRTKRSTARSGER